MLNLASASLNLEYHLQDKQAGPPVWTEEQPRSWQQQNEFARPEAVG